MTISEISNAEVVKCTCGAGDTRTLNMLRATTLADLNVDEYNEIVGAVNKAGGIVKTVGIWRLLIAKAAEEYTQGVLKGDFVGHPFRGNQHSDASGAGRGGAGGTPSKRKVNATALRQFDRVMAENRKGTKASQDKGETSSGRSKYDAYDKEAQQVIRSVIADKISTTVDKVNETIIGVNNLSSAANLSMQNNQRNLSDKLNNPYLDIRSDSSVENAIRADKRTIDLASETRNLLNETYSNLSLVQPLMANYKRPFGGLLDDFKIHIDPSKSMKDLQTLRSKLRDVTDAERSNDRALGGRSGSHGMRLALLQRAVTDTIDSLTDVIDEVSFAGRNANDFAQQLAAENN